MNKKEVTEGNSDVFVKKTWFIKTNSGRLEDFYDFDVRKVNNNLKYLLIQLKTE